MAVANATTRMSFKRLNVSKVDEEKKVNIRRNNLDPSDVILSWAIGSGRHAGTVMHVVHIGSGLHMPLP